MYLYHSREVIGIIENCLENCEGLITPKQVYGYLKYYKIQISYTYATTLFRSYIGIQVALGKAEKVRYAKWKIKTKQYDRSRINRVL